MRDEMERRSWHGGEMEEKMEEKMEEMRWKRRWNR